MGNKNLEYIINEVSGYLIERGHAKSKEALKFEWHNPLLNLVGIKEGIINTPPEKKISIRIEAGLRLKDYRITLKGDYLDEKNDKISLKIDPRDKRIKKKETRSENLGQLFRVIPEAKLYPASDFLSGLYKGLSDTAVLFFLFKNLESKNLAALASITDYGVINFGEWFGEKRGYTNMREYLSGNVPRFNVSNIFDSYKKKFVESKPWLARKQFENYLFEKYCDKNKGKFTDLYLCKVEEINKILNNPAKEWKEDAVDNLTEKRVDAKKVIELIQFDEKADKFIITPQNKTQLEKIIAEEIVKDNTEDAERCKGKLKEFYEILNKTDREIKTERIGKLLFPGRNIRDKKLLSLASSILPMNTAEIEEMLKKLNKELTEKKLRTERGRFSDFTRNFCDILEKGYYNEGRSLEQLQDAADALANIKAKKELSKRDIKTINEFISDYVYTQRMFLEDNKAISEEQKQAAETKIKSVSELIPEYTKNKEGDYSSTISSLESYLLNSRKLIKDLDGYNERKYIGLEELEDLARDTVQSITRQLNKEELEKITENSFRILNRNKTAELVSFGSLIGLGVASKLYEYGNKWGWGAVIGVKSFLDGFIIGETNRMTEAYFLYQYRKHLENSNVDPDLAFSEFNSLSMRCYNTGSAIGMGIGLPFIYMSSDKNLGLISIPIGFAVLSAGAAGFSHYLFQKMSRARFRKQAVSTKQTLQIATQEVQVDAKQLKDATALKTEKNEVSA